MEMRYKISKSYHSTLKDFLEDMDKSSGPMFLVDDVELHFSKGRIFNFKIKDNVKIPIVGALNKAGEDDKWLYLKKNYVFIGPGLSMIEIGPYKFSELGTISFYKEYANESAEKLNKMDNIYSISSIYSKDFSYNFVYVGFKTNQTKKLELAHDWPENLDARIEIEKEMVNLIYETPESVKKTIVVREKSMPDSSVKFLINELEKQKFRNLEKIISREGENKFKIATFTPKLSVYIVEKKDFWGMPFVISKKLIGS